MGFKQIEICEESIKRFRNYISVNGTCWEWRGPKSGKEGYGKIHYKGDYERAHRFSYRLHKGPASNLWVLHKCDNPKCVNPEHLFLGNATDNERDMRAKGRKAKVTWLGGVKKSLKPEHMAMLGLEYDSTIAKLASVNPKTVIRIREELKIPALTYRKKPMELSERAKSLLGVLTDLEVAEIEGVNPQVITAARRRKGISPTSKPRRCSPRLRDEAGRFAPC